MFDNTQKWSYITVFRFKRNITIICYLHGINSYDQLSHILGDSKILSIMEDSFRIDPDGQSDHYQYSAYLTQQREPPYPRQRPPSSIQRLLSLERWPDLSWSSSFCWDHSACTVTCARNLKEIYFFNFHRTW